MTLRKLLPLLGAALLGAAALAGLGALTAPEAPAPAKAATYTAPDRTYAIATPAGWRATAQGRGGAVLERRDGRGMVVIRRRAAVATPLDALAGQLTRRLRREIGDFQPAHARVASLPTGRALVYTFVRPRADTVQSIVVAPAGRAAYTLDMIAAGDAPDVARELGGMARSFRARPV